MQNATVVVELVTWRENVPIRNATLVVELVISREIVPTQSKIAQEDIQNGPRRTNQVCKITVNMDQNLQHEDATVNAMVGMGGKMLKCRLLVDSGADFSCVSNEVLLRMEESGMAVAVVSDLAAKASQQMKTR